MSDIMTSRAQVIADNQALQQRLIDAEAKVADLQSRPVLVAREKITENPETVAKLAKAQARIVDLERQLAAVEDVAPIKAALAEANAKVKKLARVQAVIDQVEARNNG